MNKYYLLVLLASLLSAISQILLKVSARKKYNNRILEYLNPWVITSYMMLAVTLLITTYVLRYITIVSSNAINCTSYLFVMIIGRIVLKEKIGWNLIVGNIIVLCGIMLVIT